MRTRHVAFGLGLLGLRAGLVRAERIQSARVMHIDAVSVTGNARTRRETLLELLPRQPPAEFTNAELAEFERRVGNLAIFDRVKIEQTGSTLNVDIREKWTLIPNVDFASSQTLADAYALVGLTEYNAFGTGNQLALHVFREQRGWGTVITYAEHPYRRQRWAFDVAGSASTARFRFEDGSSWTSTQFGAELGFTSPPWLSDHLGYHAGAYYFRELISERVGNGLPPSSHALGMMMAFAWDDYHWADFTPRGVRTELQLSWGAFIGTGVPQPKHVAEINLIWAHPLARYTVVMGRGVGAVSTRGNAGFSQLLGSQAGVRGLEDGLFRNWLQAYGNFELRQALPFAERWALQGVLFSDVAAFEQIDSDGGRGRAGSAYCVGVGARLIPTWLANVILRADLARLLIPTHTWFLQIGLNQYF